MSDEGSRAEPLSPQDAALLTALFNAAGASTPWVEAKVFRHKHIDQLKAVDRLVDEGYIRKDRLGDKECYAPSLTALAQLREQPLIADVLSTAEFMWRRFQDHYRESMELPITLKAVADAIGKPVDHVTLVHAYMREWWHTPCCFTSVDARYQSVTVSEKVFDHLSFEGCIEELQRLQLSGLGTQAHGFKWPPLGCEDVGSSQAPQVPRFDEPSCFDRLPPHAQALLREVHVARHLALWALAAMGVRAVIDVVADDLLGSAAGQGFKQKLDALRKAGLLTDAQFETIRAVIDVGHAAAHRAHAPSERDVTLMLEALWHVMFSAYGLQSAKDELISRTPSLVRGAKMK